MSGFPGSRLRGRLLPGAPAVDGLEPGRWHDVFGGASGRAGLTGSVLLRPRDVLPEDASGYIPVPRQLVELGGSDGSRLLTDQGGQRWLAVLVPDPVERGMQRLRVVCQDGRYVLIGGLDLPTLDSLSDDALLAMLAAQLAGGERPSGVRMEARVKPAFAWGYRMLDPGASYLVDPRWTTDRALVLATVDGDRVVDAGHFEVQTFLD